MMHENTFPTAPPHSTHRHEPQQTAPHEPECDLQCRIAQLQTLVAQLLVENERLRQQMD